MLCQPLQSFHGLIKELRSEESNAEGRESRRISGECKKGEILSKEKQKGDEKGNRLETDRVQRACLFTIVCEHDGEINPLSRTADSVAEATFLSLPAT